jgi:hypothetical protein
MDATSYCLENIRFSEFATVLSSVILKFCTVKEGIFKRTYCLTTFSSDLQEGHSKPQITIVHHFPQLVYRFCADIKDYGLA